MVWKMRLAKQRHELLKSHLFKVFVLKFDPVDKTYVLDTSSLLISNLYNR